MCRAGFPLLPPLKIKSATLSARMTLVERVPRTNWIASPEFDLPEPFGPVIAVKPSSNGTVISPPNDLKFSSSILSKCIPSPC